MICGEIGKARAVADRSDARVLASVEIAVPRERVFRALIRHDELPTGEACERTSIGWETSLLRLVEILEVNQLADHS
jgi:hypothetical protein